MIRTALLIALSTALLGPAAGCPAEPSPMEASARPTTGGSVEAQPPEPPPKKDAPAPSQAAGPVNAEGNNPWAAYFDTPPLKEALASFLAGANVAAAQAFDAYVRTKKTGPRVLPARFLALLAWHDAGVFSPTANDLDVLGAEWPLMAGYCHYYAGSARLKADRLKRGLQSLRRVPKDSPLYSRAVEKMATAVSAHGRVNEGIALLRSLLRQEGQGRQETWGLYTRLLRRAGRRDKAQAAAVETLLRNPTSAAGREADKWVKAGEGLSPKANLRLGKVFQKRQLHRRALTALGAAAEGFPRASRSRCEALLGLGRTYEKMKKRGRAWHLFNRALGCQGEGRALATFWGGRNRLRAGDTELAIDLFEKHLAEFPERSTADDVHVLLAQAERDRGNPAKAERRLFQAIKNYPNGDMADDATWALLWPLIEGRRLREAEHMARRLLEIPRRETHRGAEGRLRYWAGWIYAQRGKAEEAQTLYRSVIESHPLSWYALLAGSRLRQIDPAGTRVFLAQDCKLQPSAEVLGDAPAKVLSDPHFLRARELSRMGLHLSSRREMKAMSKDTPAEARRWAKARLFRAGNFYARASGLARPGVKRVGEFWPGDAGMELWKMAFPRAFPVLVERWAGTHQVDPYWVWSIMRTESNFKPDVTSWAGAHGLMQIILPTAKRLARKTPIRVNRRRLKDPAVSIQLGTKFLAKLKRRHPVLACASAGYNAGGGAIRKWRRKFGHVELDEFVEKMPYDEARRYAKRVVSTMATYRWIYEGEVPQIDLTPPGS